MSKNAGDKVRVAVVSEPSSGKQRHLLGGFGGQNQYKI